MNPMQGHSAGINVSDRDSQLDAAYQGTRIGLDQALGLIETLQRDLDSMRNELAWSHRLSTLGTMSATLAHEFNNLLTPIGIYAQIALADTNNREKTTRALEAAVKGVAQASRLAEATLGFAGPEEHAEGETAANLIDVVEQALACVGPRLDQSHVTVERGGITAHTLAIKPLALQQVLVNLMSNAERAMRAVGGKRRIWLRSKEQGESLVIAVQDSGPGVAEAIRKTLFEPFITQQPFESDDLSDRLDNSSGNSGTGLGLNICRTLIESAGGTIQLAQQRGGAGRGACFEIRLAIAKQVCTSGSENRDANFDENQSTCR